MYENIERLQITNQKFRREKKLQNKHTQIQIHTLYGWIHKEQQQGNKYVFHSLFSCRFTILYERETIFMRCLCLCRMQRKEYLCTLSCVQIMIHAMHKNVHDLRAQHMNTNCKAISPLSLPPFPSPPQSVSHFSSVNRFSM